MEINLGQAIVLIIVLILVFGVFILLLLGPYINCDICRSRDVLNPVRSMRSDSIRIYTSNSLSENSVIVVDTSVRESNKYPLDKYNNVSVLV